jgi:bifunctional DNase/RNase
MEETDMDRTVEVLGVHLEPMTGESIVLLGERNEVTHVLPIFIGAAEARSIVVALAGLEPPRPNTHDLMIDVMAVAGSRVTGVVVTDLVDGTFHAELDVAAPSGSERVGCRPSDGIALAVRSGAAIRVDDGVFNAAAVEVEHEPDTAFTDDQIEAIVSEFEEYLRTAEPEDFVIEPEAPEDDGADAEGES